MRLRIHPAAIAIAAIWAVSAGQITAQTHQREFQFEQFPAEVYKGPIHIPSNLNKDDGTWRDELGKWVADPEVDFAGAYYLTAHSCGAGCRYYQLTNLRTGADIPEISMFNGGDPPPKTTDGRSYLTILYYKPDSSLIIAEYLLESVQSVDWDETCRQRYFVLENGKIKPISKTFSFCTEQHQGRQ